MKHLEKITIYIIDVHISYRTFQFVIDQCGTVILRNSRCVIYLRYILCIVSYRPGRCPPYRTVVLGIQMRIDFVNLFKVWMKFIKALFILYPEDN
ncbi:hypothetical protein D3C73_853940 [compost metagenome]